MRSLIHKSFISTGLVLASLALDGHAMAATAHVKARTTPPAASRLGVDVAAIPPYPNYTSAAGPNSQRNGRFSAAARPAYPHPVGRYFGAGPGIDVGQLVGTMLGMVPPQYAGIVQSGMRQASHRSSSTSSGTYDPSFDSPTTSTPIDNSASDAAAASAAAVSEQNLNDDMAMAASMAAAEQENDVANAAALQTEINAGM
jgi:hypothetical protein